MRTDLIHKLAVSVILTAIPLFAAIITTFFIVSNVMWFSLLPLIFFACAFAVLLILGFVPFMKDHMWLSVIAAVLLCALAGLIINLVI